MQQIVSGQLRLNPAERVKQPPLIAHVIYHLGVGGLENGVVRPLDRLVWGLLDYGLFLCHFAAP